MTADKGSGRGIGLAIVGGVRVGLFRGEVTALDLSAKRKQPVKLPLDP
jgi:hypothetical protein